MCDTTNTINIPPAITGVDAKWIVRGIITQMLFADDNTRNAYAHCVMTIRDRVWESRRYGKAARQDMTVWQPFLDQVKAHGETHRTTWDGDSYSAQSEWRAVNGVLRDLATYEPTNEVAEWWRMFLVCD